MSEPLLRAESREWRSIRQRFAHHLVQFLRSTWGTEEPMAGYFRIKPDHTIEVRFEDPPEAFFPNGQKRT